MKRTFFAAFAAALMVSSCCQSPVESTGYDVIPLPSEIKTADGQPFILSGKTVIVATEGHEATAQFLADYINEMTGLKVKVAPTRPEKDYITISTTLDAAPESYAIKVSENAIDINAADEDGAFHAVQTLRKSLPIAQKGSVKVSLPAAEINDTPRFGYRGMHLDVSRHFFSTDFVKKYIDMLALHNMNKLHWHLTEDQGWRVEIKAYPELTKTGAYRRGTQIGRDRSKIDSVRYGGFYTQEEIRDVVAYAKDRHIDIIPEVDLPGHMLAALATYPELGCTGGPYETCCTWGVYKDVLCAGNDKVYEFLRTVLGEFCELFPCEYFHIGGDECPKDRWKECEKCQAKIKELGIVGTKEHPAEAQLQNYVMMQMEEFLKAKGKKIIGWDEILEGGTDEDAIVMSWRGEEGGIAGAQSGHDVIMTANQYLYFDYYQSDDKENEPLAIGGYVPVEKVYNYEPVPEPLRADPELAKHIIGVQANLWTEYIATEEYAEYMAIPRADALSEIQWTDGQNKDYPYFVSRLGRMRAIYDLLGYNYGKHVFTDK